MALYEAHFVHKISADSSDIKGPGEYAAHAILGAGRRSRY